MQNIYVRIVYIVTKKPNNIFNYFLQIILNIIFTSCQNIVEQMYYMYFSCLSPKAIVSFYETD